MTSPDRDEWREVALRAVSSHQATSSNSTTTVQSRSMRSLQIDAERLDEELNGIVLDKMASALSLISPDRVSFLENELKTCVQGLVFFFTVWRGLATPGQTLLNLEYASSSHPSGPEIQGNRERQGTTALTQMQRALLGIGSILVPYTWSKIQSTSHSANRHQPSQSDRLARGITDLWQFLTVLNFLAFLREGKYRNVLERLLGVVSIYKTPVMNRAIGWEVLNRQLVWREVSELLLFVLPILNAGMFQKIFPSINRFFKQDTGKGGRLNESPVEGQVDPTCPVCGTSDIVTPYEAVPCGHVYCYYCLRASSTKGGFDCLVCSAKILAMKRWNVKYL